MPSNVFASGVTLSLIQQGSKGTFAETLGLEFTELGPDFLRAALTVDARHLRPGGIVNGGVFLSILETVGSVAARCTIESPTKNSLGIQVSCNHLGVAVPGDRLIGTARPVHLGRSTHLWEVEIENQKGKVISSGRITLLIVDK
jgi:1,4-dihydroxy-2-naphthoyl-CoA hydrolase